MRALLLIAHGAVGLSVVVVSILAVRAKAPEALRRLTGKLLLLVLLQTLVGDVLYPIYLRSAKPILRTFADGSRSAADLFEIKEHLAFFALALAIGAHLAARNGSGPIARVLVAAAHAAIVVVATLGLAVASLRLP